ncbi:hypothetical protein JMJ77_0006772 [Colletotrichum scovillei]|uniref:Uncharacterized protein n=1 Tax=Colletotrichum scovillei TaxID=1209932 RepID=A0A9P7UIJ6_9PEZI|nr:hypothetical protein JMJ77_0006772 [Colletotrichum scovillei]KAG7078017.1 hypothetical protein JMJ76_0015256 [Colletotrichum scovillei]KAG7085143.1 hypothetical protein JMJ78_0010570 [Colletotrichum scovillei]
MADATNTKERAAYKTWASFHFFFPVADFLHGNLLDNFYMRRPIFCSDPRTVLALGHSFASPTVQNTRASSVCAAAARPPPSISRKPLYSSVHGSDNHFKQRDQQVMRQSKLFAHGGLGIRGLRLSPPNSSRQPASITVTEDAGRVGVLADWPTLTTKRHVKWLWYRQVMAALPSLVPPSGRWSNSSVDVARYWHLTLRDPRPLNRSPLAYG